MVNAAVLDLLRASGIEPCVLNTSPTSLSRSFLARLDRLPRVLRSLRSMLSIGIKGSGVLYMSLSGGWGQVYDLIVLVIARALRLHVVVHHHSFAYLTEKSRLTAACVNVVGRHGMHVLLCTKMAHRFRTEYPRATNALVVSNVAFINDDFRHGVPSPRTSVRVIGFLSNISEDKGIFLFLDVMKSIARRGGDLGIRALIAGPFVDDATRRNVEQRLSELPNVEYVGPKYDAAKRAFYSEIDVLLFPSFYRNEAEPLTILEATSLGVPVIATGRGCVEELATETSSIYVHDRSQFIDAATERVLGWAANPLKFQEVSAQARACYILRRNLNQAAFEKLFGELNAGSAQPAGSLEG